MKKISTASLTDIAVLNDRYAVVKDLRGIYRVVSLVRTPATPLTPRLRVGGEVTYVFNRTGMGPSWDKTTYDQQGLESTVSRYGKTPTQAQFDQLRTAIDVVAGAGQRKPLERDPAFAGAGKSAAIPVSSHVLDPFRGGWIIATVTPTGLLFGSKPKVHYDAVVAEAELQRLATVSPGTEFVLLKAVKTAVTAVVQTKEFA